MKAIKKTARLRSDYDQRWYDRFHFSDIDDNIVTTDVPRDLTCDARLLWRHLLANGADLPELAKCREALTRLASAPAKTIRQASRNGWRPPDSRCERSFVSFKYVAAPTQTDAIVPPSIAPGSCGANVDLRGTLREWQDAIKTAAYSTTMMVTLSAVFAAPLLRPLNRPNFGLALYGPSRCGKSTAQLVGASALGYGSEEDMPTLNATPAGLLAAGLAFNDHMLPINEVATASTNKREVTAELRGATYALMSGHDRLRYPSWTGRSAGENSFKGIVILSSEVSPDEWAERAGDTRDPGETARLIGLPACIGGATSVFDLRPSGATDDWQRTLFDALRHDIPLQRGVAFRIYVTRFSRSYDLMVAYAKWAVGEFERRMSRPDMSHIERDILAKFGILLAGAFCAIKLGVLPFTFEQVRQSIARACRAALASLPNAEADLDRDLKILRQLMSSNAILDFRRAPPREQWRHAIGYRSETGTSVRFTINARALDRTFAGQTSRLFRILARCDDEGLLRHTKPRRSGRSIEWAESQPTWPDGSRPRSFVFEMPRGLSGFDEILNTEPSSDSLAT